MTPIEFKAWFEGFTEAMDRLPTRVQWDKIKARVAEIDGQPVTERIFVDRYLPTPVPYWPTGISYTLPATIYPQWNSTDSENAMYYLGRNDASN